MPRRKSRKQAKSAATLALFFQAVAAIVSAIALAIVAYYKWAAKITHPKRRTAAYLTPVCLVAVFSILSWATTPAETTVEPVARPAPQPVYEYNDEFESADGNPVESTPEVEPPTATGPQLSVEPEPDVPELEPEVAPEPVSTDTYVSGTCKDLKAQGLGPFYPGDANYTSKRDRDNDGIACE